jgi:hypothetical protein
MLSARFRVTRLTRIAPKCQEKPPNAKKSLTFHLEQTVSTAKYRLGIAASTECSRLRSEETVSAFNDGVGHRDTIAISRCGALGQFGRCGVSSIPAENDMSTSTTTQIPQSVKPNAIETDCYQLILFNHSGTSVLLRQQCSLPQVDIPRFTRPAEQITSLLREIWGLSTVLLFSDKVRSGDVFFAALEEVSGISTIVPGLKWFPVQRAASELPDSNETAALQSSYAKASEQSTDSNDAPFSRLGWMSRLQDWVATILRPIGAELSNFRQLNGSECFSLIRFETTKQPVWFKAVGKPNTHEFPITLLLSELFPHYVPTILGFNPALNGWLMKHVGDSTLRDREDSQAWLRTTRFLAELQLESAGQTAQLLRVGCRDLRVAALSSVADEFFDSMGLVMQKQTKVLPLALTRQELQDVCVIVKESLHALDESGIPNALGHSDFSPGNILVDRDRLLFTDWAEAHVGHPFLTFEYLLSHLRKVHPFLAKYEQDLRREYTERWQSKLYPKNIQGVVRWTTIAATYAYAISGNSWRDPDRQRIPHVLACLRALTRKMKREAEGLRLRRDT